MYPKKTQDTLILLLAYMSMTIGAGQFVVQYFDPNLAPAQQYAALFFGVIIAGIAVVINIIVWRKD